MGDMYIKEVTTNTPPENTNKPCDTGSPAKALEQEFPNVDFKSTLDPVYPDKTSPAGSAYHYTRDALLARGQTALQRLYERPEKVIVVVSHSGFLRLAVTGCFYFNADYRIFDFVQGKGGKVEIVQDPSTKEKGGGLGWSWTEQIELGTDLPNEAPPADA